MLHISFYLRTPDAREQTQVWVSISGKKAGLASTANKAKQPLSRLRFSTGESFLTQYCNVREKKGGKDLVKRNTPFYTQYTATLQSVRNTLLLIENDLRRTKEQYSLEDIRDRYWVSIGRIADATVVSFFDAYTKHTEANKTQWGEAYVKSMNSLKKHLEAFEKSDDGYKLDLSTFGGDTWQDVTAYFINKSLQNSTTNKYLDSLKQFLRFAGKRGWFPNMMHLEDWKTQQELKSFNISLKEHEVEDIIKLDLSKKPMLDRVRDLFLLEIFTGQRYSDIDKVLDRTNDDGKFIVIYQQKTGERVAIPRHSKLEAHLKVLLKKYPDGFPTLSNQKFNEAIKEVAKEAGFDQVHSWVKMIGKDKVSDADYRYNLVSSHTGRRTFCTLARKKGIDDKLIMKVTGHRKYEQYLDYVKVDDEDMEAAFSEKF